MRILHISPESIEDSEIIGGRGIWLKNIIARQTDCRLLTWADNPSDKVISIDTHFLKPTSEDYVGIMKEANFRFLKKGVEVMKDYKPDIIHLHESDSAEAAFALKELFNVPLVYTMHLSQIAMFMEGISRTKLQKYLVAQEQVAIQTADAVHVCSNYYKNKFVQDARNFNLDDHWYQTTRPIHVVGNGVNPLAFSKAGDGVSRDYINVFYAGRFCKGKGLETLCETLDLNPDIKIWLAGQFNGTKEEQEAYSTTKVINEYKEKYPDRVEVLGHMNQAQVGSWAKQMDVWVAPSWHCPFELVGLEAMACSIPLVCTKTGAFLEYCDNTNSTMVESKSAESLMQGINIAKEGKTVSGGYKTAKQYTWEKTEKQIGDMYASQMVTA